MTHRATQRVAGLHLMQHTDPYRAKWGDAPLDVAMVAPAVRRPLSAVYAHPLPVVTTRRPGRARRALGTAGWWLLKGIPAAVVIGLALLLAHGILSQLAER